MIKTAFRILKKLIRIVIITVVVLFAGMMIIGTVAQKQYEKNRAQNDYLAPNGTGETGEDDNEKMPEPGTIAYGLWLSEHGGSDNINNDPDYVWDESTDEAAAKFRTFLEPSDDEWDFMWANDYQESTILKFTYMNDQKGYSKVFGFDKPTLDEMYAAIDENPYLAMKYKNMLKEYVSGWLKLWPESDFSVLKYNLKTLKIIEASDDEIKRKSLSSGTVACYIPADNEVWLNKESNVEDKNSNDFVVFMHEITHAARTTRNNKIGELDVTACFFKDTYFGLYEDESILTYFCYQIQNLNRKSIYYTFQSNIYRQILSCIDYDGADYMNHSVNYFILKLQEYFDEIGEKIPAYHFVNLVDAEAEFHYKGYSKYGYINFCDVYRILAENYVRNHISADMTLTETEKLFDEFYVDITFNFENLSDPYPEVKPELFKIYWDKSIAELGIN